MADNNASTSVNSITRSTPQSLVVAAVFLLGSLPALAFELYRNYLQIVSPDSPVLRISSTDSTLWCLGITAFCLWVSFTGASRLSTTPAQPPTAEQIARGRFLLKRLMAALLIFAAAMLIVCVAVLTYLTMHAR